MRSHCASAARRRVAQAVFGGEGVDGRVAAGAFDDAADDRVHVVGMLLDEVADGGEALGDPRSGVEQFGGGAEDGEVDLDLASAQRFQCVRRPWRRARRRHRRRRIRVGPRAAHRSEIARQPTARRLRRGAAIAGVGVLGVEAAWRRVQTVCASSQLSAKIETQSSERHAGTTPARAEQAARRLQADEVVERRGHAARAGGVGAEREADQPEATATAEPELEPPEM